MLYFWVMDADSLSLLQKILKDSGFSMTAARQVVCELLWQQEPQSMGELAKRSQGRIDRASLYRTIGLYEKLGIVQRIYIGWKYKVELSDLLSHHHHHISCLGCGKLVAIKDEDDIEAFIARLAAKHGFTPKSHQLEIRGYCETCQLTQAASV
jgi:Fur family ferric uptake transcriptional regulator